MSNELIINVTPGETRVARLEGGVVTEMVVERSRKENIVGSIYKGKVDRVLPGMQAAFVNIGLARTGFLYVTDIYTEDEEENNEVEEIGWHGNIRDLLKEGQEILVQVTREPLGTKGARLTSHITLPGRFVVYMPTIDHIGVSRRIESDTERRRLKQLVDKMRPKGHGVIVRTVAEGVDADQLKADMEYLMATWDEVDSKRDKIKPPNLVHQELDIVLRVVRDLFSNDIDRLLIDSKEECDKIRSFVGRFAPALRERVEFYEGPEPIFDAFGIEIEISRALGKKVWLKSGGYIIIDQTEALTAIDINTGKFVGKRNLEETILKTNLEAVKEIAYQLRLRNVGGLIILDFIDMAHHGNRDKVYQALKDALKKDRARTTITKITELGLVEMTRKRTHPSLMKILGESCSYCEGKGYIKSRVTVCHEIFREIQREAIDKPHATITITAHPSVVGMLCEEEREGIEELEKTLVRKIVVRGGADFHIEQFDVTCG